MAVIRSAAVRAILRSCGGSRLDRAPERAAHSLTRRSPSGWLLSCSILSVKRCACRGDACVICFPATLTRLQQSSCNSPSQSLYCQCRQICAGHLQPGLKARCMETMDNCADIHMHWKSFQVGSMKGELRIENIMTDDLECCNQPLMLKVA